MNNPRSITLPQTDIRTAVYPCESINRVVSQDVLPELRADERRAAYVEIAQALWAVHNEIQLAVNRAALPAGDFNYKEMDLKWLNRAKALRNVLGKLMWDIRQHEKGLTPHAIEIEAFRLRRAARRRLVRQQLLIDAFADLVEEKLGEEGLTELLKKAGDRADAEAFEYEQLSEERAAERVKENESAVRRAMGF